MAKAISAKQLVSVVFIPILLLTLLITITNTPQLFDHQPRFYSYLTIDFIITVPLIYFLLIRKHKVSKLSVAPVFILCMLIASYVIPNENQDALHFAKTWLVPLVELSVIFLVAVKLKSALKYYKSASQTHTDFYSALVRTCESMFPKTAAKLVSNELALLYYGFFYFRKIELQANEYSNYKGSGILSTLGAIIVVIAVEMIGIHMLVATWSSTLAWTLTAFSIYSALQLIGIIRSVPKRPVALHEQHMQLHFGILSSTRISYESIESIAHVSSDDYKNAQGKDVRTLSFLGELEQSNLCIDLKTPQELQFIYGKPRSYQKLFLYIDDHERFKKEVESKLLNTI